MNNPTPWVSRCVNRPTLVDSGSAANMASAPLPYIGRRVLEGIATTSAGPMSEHLVILGGNTAGLAAALSARRRRPAQDLRVLVLEAGQDISYGACGMPYNLADPQRQPNDLLVRGMDHFRQLGIEVALGHRVLEVDPLARRLRLRRDGQDITLPWDRLVVATGAAPLPMSVPGLPAERHFTFRSLQDLRRLKEAIHGFQRVAVVGGGAVGLELCDALRSLDLQVLLVEAQSLPLPGFPHALRERAVDTLRLHGVELHLDSRLTQATWQGSRLGIELQGPARGQHGSVACEALVNATGQIPATDFLPANPLAKDAHGALPVDRSMATAWPGIWAAGDCVVREHAVPALPGETARLWNPQAREARRGGRVAGWNAAFGTGDDTTLPLSPGTLALKLFDLEVARCGRLGLDGVEAPLLPEPVSTVRGLLGQPLPAPPRMAQALQANVKGQTRGHGMPQADDLEVWLEADGQGLLRGGALCSTGPGAALRVNVLAALLQAQGRVEDLLELDLVYSPPFGPIEDPLLKAASRLRTLLKK